MRALKLLADTLGESLKQDTDKSTLGQILQGLYVN